MPRCVIGVTWTAEERALFNLPRSSGGTSLVRVASHETTVFLPDGTLCPVSYRRFSARSHRFEYGTPLQEAVWLNALFANTKEAIEEKAQECSQQAFSQAVAEEQRAMRRKTTPKGVRVLPEQEHLSTRAAAELAGCYAVCVRSVTGSLFAIGRVYPQYDPPIQELAEERYASFRLFGTQRLVIGICCRYLKRWIEPRLLPSPRTDSGPTEPEDADAEHMP